MPPALLERRGIFTLKPVAAIYDAIVWPMVTDAARVTSGLLQKTLGPGLRILDIGTGTGMVAQRLAEDLPADVVGVDASQEMLERARRRQAQRGSLMFHLGSAWELPSLPPFDAGVMSYLLRYLEPGEAASAFASAARAIRPGGALVVTDLALPKPGPRPVLGAWSDGAEKVIDIARDKGFVLAETRFPFLSSLFLFTRRT